MARMPRAAHDGSMATYHNATSDGFPFTRHMERCTIVLPEYRVLFVPVPKSAWTSVLRLLLRPAGLTSESFRAAEKPEVTLATAIHATYVWRRAGLSLDSLPDDVRHRAFTEDGWFRFSVVRDPATRLWSAWQSKLLLREPWFTDAFSGQPWFPRVPQNPDDVVEDFRVFVAAVREHAWQADVRDKHWAPQHLLLDRIPLTHVGHVERLGETRDALRAHLGDHAELIGSLAQDNQTPLPYSPALYDASTAAAVGELFSRDFAQFGYAPVEASTDATALATWERDVVGALPALHEIIARHDRIGAYYRRVRKVRVRSQAQARRVQQLEHTLAERTRQRNQLRSQLDQRDRSWSWRLTKPLRVVGRLGRRN